MRPHFKLIVALFTLAGLGAAGAASACFMRSPQPVTVWLDHIEVNIKDGVASKTYNCTFKNPNPQAVVGGTCYMELEPGAHVDDMRVLVDGKEMKAEILDVEKAKQVFQDIVKNGGSPALLEYYGNQLIQTQVPRVPAGGTVNVKLTYTMVLAQRDGLVRLQMLNTNPKASLQPLNSASVKVNITSKRAIKNIYSPTHKIKIVETPDADVSVQWSQKDYLPKHPFVLYYQLADDDVGASLVPYRELGDEGTFMMMLSPTIGSGAGAITSKDVLPKDIVFCVDTSGSMLEGNKMSQAQAALKYCLENLRENDRFNIVDFSTGVRAFEDRKLVEVSDASRQRALNYVKKLGPRGGTAIQDALEKSLELLRDGERLKMILFATDGLPTIGERNPEAILKKIAKQNGQDVRIFVFGEGFDVNTKLLDFLALKNRGEADYILPEEDIAKKISQFYDRVGSPIMTDLKIEIDGLKVEDMYPRTIPDLFRGEQVVVFGRYQGAGKKTVRVSGVIRGERKTIEHELDFPEYTEGDKSAFVPRLWAGRKVDFLLDQLREGGGKDQELIDEVTFLAKRYGIVTPYTSFLMTDDVAAGKPGSGQQAKQLLGNALRREAAQADGSAALAPGEKADFVKDAKKRADSRRNFSASGGALALDEAVDAEGGDRRSASLTAIRYIGARTFYRSGNRWRDSRFDGKKVKPSDVEVVKIGSKRYFDLLSQHSELAKYLALTDVDLEYKGKWYRFESAAK